MVAGTIAPNLFDRLAQWFGRTTKAQIPPADLYRNAAQLQTYPINFPGWPEYEAQQSAQAKDTANVKTALQSAWVWADVSAIAHEFSTAELVVKERQNRELTDIENHPLELLWEAPNPHMGRSYLMEYWAWSYTLFGKAALFWVADGPDVIECWPIPPYMLTPVADDKQFIRAYAFKSRPDVKPTLIDPRYVTFSRTVNLFDVRDGLSFIGAAMPAIRTDLAASAWNLNFFSDQNGVPDGLITVKQETLDQDLARIRMELRDFFGGTRRGVAVARAGDMDYTPFGRSQKEIDRTLGFPEGYWSERANRANAEQARATMIAGAVWPKLVRLAEDLNAQFVPTWYGDNYRVEFTDIRPEDRGLKLQEQQFLSSILTIDELRAEVGREPLGDKRGALFVAEIGKGPTPTDEPPADPASMPPAELPEDEDAPPPEPPMNEPEAGAAAPDDLEADMKADLRNWQRKVRDAIKRGKAPSSVKYAPDTLPELAAATIRAELAHATTLDEVTAVFDAAFGALKATPIDEVWSEALDWARKALEP